MKVVTLQQLEQDLDRLLDGVIEEGEHFRVSVSWITCADTINEPCIDSKWKEKSVIMLPAEDYEFFQEIYKEWQADAPIRHAIEDAPAFEELREERKEEDRLMAWA